MCDRQGQLLDALQAVGARVSAAVAVAALAHQVRELRAVADKLAEDVVGDIRPRVARREVLRVEAQAEHLLLQGGHASGAEEEPELERLPAAAREVAPAVAEAHELGEVLRGNVVHFREGGGAHTYA